MRWFGKVKCRMYIQVYVCTIAVTYIIHYSRTFSHDICLIFNETRLETPPLSPLPDDVFTRDDYRIENQAHNDWAAKIREEVQLSAAAVRLKEAASLGEDARNI